MTHQVLHTLSLHCRCDIPDSTDFFSHHTLSSCCRNDLLILQTLSPHSTKLSSYCRCDLPCATHFLYLYCRCDTLDTADFSLHNTPVFLLHMYHSDTVQFLLTLHNLLLVMQQRPSWYCTFLASYHRSNLADTTEFLITLDTL